MRPALDLWRDLAELRLCCAAARDVSAHIALGVPPGQLLAVYCTWEARYRRLLAAGPEDQGALEAWLAAQEARLGVARAEGEA